MALHGYVPNRLKNCVTSIFLSVYLVGLEAFVDTALDDVGYLHSLAGARQVAHYRKNAVRRTYASAIKFSLLSVYVHELEYRQSSSSGFYEFRFQMK